MPAPTIEEAIEALRKLPPRRQHELAGYILNLAPNHREPEPVDPADLPFVMEGLDQANRRQFASPDHVARALGLEDK